jgi:hypothetical protein
MKLADYCDAINADLILRRYSAQNGRWTASFDRCEVKEGHMLSSEYGNADTPEAAMADYCKKIAGKRIAFNVGSVHRREFDVPIQLEV